MTTTILVLSSHPLDTKYLGLNKEFSEIEKARKLSKNKNNYSILRVPAASIDDLQREILETKARIVHFCGHGLGHQGLVLEAELGKQQLISTQALAGLFELLANQVECVILNACFSDAQAAVIGDHINYVIGTKNAIRDDAAIAFSKGFYVSLFSGKAIKRAYEFGKSNIQLEISVLQRKLVPVTTEEKELPEEEVFTFYTKEPLNSIYVEPEPSSGNQGETRNVNINQGNYVENLGRDYINVDGDFIQVQGDVVFNSDKQLNLKQPSNLKKIPSTNFVGREKQLEELHQLLQQNKQVTISAIAGMGGIGKTELALQYVQTYRDEYQGSLCWFSVREQNLATQVIEFAGTHLNLYVPDLIKSEESKVEYCWSNWRSEKSLIILDDVPNYGEFYRDRIAPYLPTATNNIKVLMTSRERPGSNISRIDLDVLTETAALELLRNLIGKSRIAAESDLAKELCQWLGYLPLGLELVGRYIALDENLTIEKTFKRLEKKKLEARALLDPEQADMNAQLGVATAFDLSWESLSPKAQEIACYLSLFSSEPFEWSWVEIVLIEEEDENKREDQIANLEELRIKQLINRSLLKPVSNSQAYQLHALIAQYLSAKLEESAEAVELKLKFCMIFIIFAGSIPPRPSQKDIQKVSLAIPHLSFTATNLIKYVEYIDNNMLIWPFLGLARFYEGQGIYNQAEFWLKLGSYIFLDRFDQDPQDSIDRDIVTILNHLSEVYRLQGKYEEAESSLLQALELDKKLLEKDNPDIATSLNNLSALYLSQKKYEEAEPLLLQALELHKKLLGEEHPHVANSLNNLAELYRLQGRYKEAEPLYYQALKIVKSAYGEEHSYVASSLNNLGLLYHLQGKYEKAESLLLQALKLHKKLLGEEHPYIATGLNNLAELYRLQEKYEEAEPLYFQALKITKAAFGEEHPNIAVTLGNLSLLYDSQGRYEKAEPLRLQALELNKKLLGE